MICPGCNAPIDHLNVKEIVIQNYKIVRETKERVIRKRLIVPYRFFTYTASLEETDDYQKVEVTCPRCGRVLYKDIDTALEDFQSCIDRERKDKGGSE